MPFTPGDSGRMARSAMRSLRNGMVSAFIAAVLASLSPLASAQYARPLDIGQRVEETALSTWNIDVGIDGTPDYRRARDPCRKERIGGQSPSPADTRFKSHPSRGPARRTRAAGDRAWRCRRIRPASACARPASSSEKRKRLSAPRAAMRSPTLPVLRPTASVRADAKDAEIRVATFPSLATYWLVPRVARFQSLHGTAVSIDTSSALKPLSTHTWDVAIRHGRGKWPGCNAEKLFDEDLIAVCSPSYRGGDLPVRPSELANHSVLTYLGSREWQQWAAKADAASRACRQRPR